MAGRQTLDGAALGSGMLVFGFENGRDFCATSHGLAGESAIPLITGLHVHCESLAFSTE